MAGAAITAPMTLVGPWAVITPEAIIKNAEVVNEGDLVGIDSSGFVVVASKTASGIIKPVGFAFFDQNNSTGGALTGDGSTVTCGIARCGKLLNATSTLVPSLAKGLPVYLGPTPTSTVSNYTCAKTTTNTDAMVQVGFVHPNGTTLEISTLGIQAGIQYQTSGNSTVNIA